MADAKETDQAPQIAAEDFFKVEMRIGRIAAAEPFPEARKPAYKLTIDFGDFGTRRSSAQLTALYAPEDLVGRLVVAATNLGTRRIAGFTSEVLVLGCLEAGGGVALLQPDRDVPLGARIH
ncbi:export-related chaperone CsaA [Desulfovibrio sp. X2]|uniref:tRNA-binding protein n=1 Tax=Desulfovibrio sp. X2 TaxID=941449 RepID=UPI000358CAC3|nr:tRNA-binding protein [Desulfovibrio sp. X2]EPR37400.1 export-related chaperone CsaA [Desulfovibrio sp. X2]